MPRSVDRLIGIVAEVSRGGKSTVVDYVARFRSTTEAGGPIKLEVCPDPFSRCFRHRTICRRCMQQFRVRRNFQQDDASGTTVRVRNLIIG